MLKDGVNTSGYQNGGAVLPQPWLWVLGHSLYNGFSWFYDYVFFGFIIYLLGPIFGGLLLFVTTAIVDYYSLKFYFGSQQDLLGIEYVRSFRRYSGKNILKRAFGYILNYAPTWIKIIVLTPKSNAFLTTALLREGEFSFAKMTTRDWKVFWGSFLCSQLYWVTMVWLGVEGIQGLFALMTKS